MPVGAPTAARGGIPIAHLPPLAAIPRPPAPEPVFAAPQVEWNPAREAPPHDSKPEAANLAVGNYEFNTDPQPFRAPQSYPEPPKDMWYPIPEEKPGTEKLKPIFPWEERELPKPSRRFVEDEFPLRSPEPEPSFVSEFEVQDEPQIEPRTPMLQVNDSAPWQAFTSSRNAWDEVTGIDDYVRALTAFQKNRGKVQVLQTNVPSQGQPEVQTSVLSPQNEPDPDDLIDTVERRRESILLTDFPTAIERPSLPVTPAPIRRAMFWSGERDDQGELPAAEGVPHQADWVCRLITILINPSISPVPLKWFLRVFPSAIQSALSLRTSFIPSRNCNNHSSCLIIPPIPTSNHILRFS